MTPLTARKQERKLVHTVHQFVHHFSVLIYAPILQDRFQKRNSPLGFMIAILFKKRFSLPFKGVLPPKKRSSPEKNLVHL